MGTQNSSLLQIATDLKSKNKSTLIILVTATTTTGICLLLMTCVPLENKKVLPQANTAPRCICKTKRRVEVTKLRTAHEKNGVSF